MSTLLFSAGDDQILVDGFFTRPRIWMVLFGKVGANEERIDERLGDAGVTRLHAILVAHGHYDHVLDAATIAGSARFAGAPKPIVVGTAAVAEIANSTDLPPSQVCTPGDKKMSFGPFKVRAIHGEHGPALRPLRWLLTGTPPEKIRLPAWFGNFKDDDNLSYAIEYGDRQILVHASAGRPLAQLPSSEVVFLGIGGLGTTNREFVEGYWKSIVSPQAKIVIPVHWDQFTQPLEEGFDDAPWPFDRVQKTIVWMADRPADGASMCFMKPFGRLDLPAAGPLSPGSLLASKSEADRIAC